MIEQPEPQPTLPQNEMLRDPDFLATQNIWDMINITNSWRLQSIEALRNANTFEERTLVYHDLEQKSSEIAAVFKTVLGADATDHAETNHAWIHGDPSGNIEGLLNQLNLTQPIDTEDPGPIPFSSIDRKLLATIRHDIVNPFHFITGYASMLVVFKESEFTPELHTDAQVIDQTLEQGLPKHLTDMRDLLVNQAGPEVTSLPHLLHLFNRSIESYLYENQLTKQPIVHVPHTETLPNVKVNIRHWLMNRAVLTLLSNATKAFQDDEYNHREKTSHIIQTAYHLSEDGKHLILTLTDNGPGLRDKPGWDNPQTKTQGVGFNAYDELMQEKDGVIMTKANRPDANPEEGITGTQVALTIPVTEEEISSPEN